MRARPTSTKYSDKDNGFSGNRILYCRLLLVKYLCKTLIISDNGSDYDCQVGRKSSSYG